MPAGRPTKYKKSFCKLLIDHMAKGMSFESFAGRKEVRVSRSQIYMWREKHKEFQDAFEIGQSASEYFLESAAFTAAFKPKENPVNTWLFGFILKNRLNWADKVEHKGDAQKPITLNYKLD